MTQSEAHSMLRKRERQRLISRGFDLTCRRCGKPIRSGQRIVRKRCSHLGKFTMKYYHEVCWNKMFF